MDILKTSEYDEQEWNNIFENKSKLLYLKCNLPGVLIDDIKFIGIELTDEFSVEIIDNDKFLITSSAHFMQTNSATFLVQYIDPLIFNLGQKLISVSRYKLENSQKISNLQVFRDIEGWLQV